MLLSTASSTGVLSITGLIAAGALLWTAITAITFTRRAVRDMFGLPYDTRSVVLCESADRHAVMDRVDQFKEVPGVLNVLLVYHHAEPAHALDEALPSLSILSATGDAHEHTS